MTKKEIRSAINKAVYQYAETLGYQMEDVNDGSCVTFYKPGESIKESIDYSRSYHETYALDWSSNETKADANLIEQFAKQQVKKYSLGI